MTIEDFMRKYDLTRAQVVSGCHTKRFEYTVVKLDIKQWGGAKRRLEIPETERNLKFVERLKTLELKRPCPTKKSAEVEAAYDEAERSSFYRNDLMGNECRRNNYYDHRKTKRVRGYQPIVYAKYQMID